MQSSVARNLGFHAFHACFHRTYTTPKVHRRLEKSGALWAAGKLGCASSKPGSVKEHHSSPQQTKPATAQQATPAQTTDPPAASTPVAGAAAAGPNGGITAQLSSDETISQQLQRLQPLLEASLQQQQQQQQQEQPQQQQQQGSGLSGVADASGTGRSGSLQPPLSTCSYSVQSFDDLGATDSAASSPRSRSSYAASSHHHPPSRGASGSGADFRSGKLRRPPRAQSSGVGLRSTLLEDNQQLSFTDSITNTNTTNSSEASPRRGQWQPGSRTNPQQLQDAVEGNSLHGGDAYLRCNSSQLGDSSALLPQLNASAVMQQQDPTGMRRVASGSDYAGSLDGDNAAGPASTFGGSSIGGFAPRMSSVTGRRSSICDPASSGQMSLLQLQRAIEKIMVSDGEMYAKLQAGLKGIHSLARETNKLTVARDVTGATCINQYVVVKTLGRGSYGKVKLCLNTLDGQLYAIKMMNRSCLLRTLQRPRAGLRKSARRSVSASNAVEAAHQQAQHTATAVAAAAAAGLTSGGLCSDEANDVNREIAILKKLDHPNVVKLFEVIDPPGSQYMMLVMEFLEKGPVLQTNNQSGFGSLPEEVAADFFRQAVLGLEYLHFHKVVHGDIKPENLLVSSNGELKISDFGCSRMADGQSSQAKLTGTPAFTAPELVSGSAADPFAADVWALGACLFCFIYGRVPFPGGCVLDVFKAIANQPLELPEEVMISPHLRDLFTRLFDKNPETRITLQDIMCHPWVTDEGRAPLRSCADLGLGSIEVTAQEQLGAIDRASVVSMIRARLKEKVFRSNEYLFQTGQPMNCVYFVMSGAVEILRSATQEDVEREFSGNTSIEHSFTVDIDESLMLDCSVVGDMMPIGAVNGRLHIDRLKARDLKHRHRGHLMEYSEVVIDVKGPGQVVGEVFMQEAPPPCRYSARARGDVLALKLTQENYVRALAAMMYEAEHGARASAHSMGASRGRPLPSATASSPGLLGIPASSSSVAAGAAAAGGASGSGPLGQVAASPYLVSGGSSTSTRPPGFGSFSTTTGSFSTVGGSFSVPQGVPHPAAALSAARGPAGGLLQSSTCGSIASGKETLGHQYSSTPGDSSTAPLSLIAATNSSSGSIVRGGGASSPYRTSGPLAGISRGTTGSLPDDYAPLQLIGSGDGTDDEGTDVDLRQQQQQMHKPGVHMTNAPKLNQPPASILPGAAVQAAAAPPPAAIAAGVPAMAGAGTAGAQ